MAKMCLEMDFTDFRDIYLWASQQDAPEAHKLAQLMERKIDAAAARIEYTQAILDRQKTQR